MTREEAALGQLFVRFTTSREAGFVLKGEVKEPITKEAALAEWEAKEAEFALAVKDPVLIEKYGLDKPTPETESPIKPVLDLADEIKLHDDTSVKVAEPTDPKEPVVTDPKLGGGGGKG
jgi:hypothetical protein